MERQLPFQPGKTVHHKRRETTLCPLSAFLLDISLPISCCDFKHTHTHTRTHTHTKKEGGISETGQLDLGTHFATLLPAALGAVYSYLLLLHAGWCREKTPGPLRAPPEHLLIHKTYFPEGLYGQHSVRTSPHHTYPFPGPQSCSLPSFFLQWKRTQSHGKTGQRSMAKAMQGWGWGGSADLTFIPAQGQWAGAGQSLRFLEIMVRGEGQKGQAKPGSGTSRPPDPSGSQLPELQSYTYHSRNARQGDVQLSLSFTYCFFKSTHFSYFAVS